MKTTIGTKLGLGFGTVIALLAVSALTAYYNLSFIQSNLANALDGAVVTVRKCDRLLSDLNQVSAALRGYLAVDPASPQAEQFKTDNARGWESARLELSLLSELIQSRGTPDDHQQLNTLTKLVNEQAAGHVAMLSAEDAARAEQVWATEALPRGREIRSILERITNSADERRHADRGELDAAGRRTMIALTGATLVSIAVGSLVALLLSRSIVTTVRALADRAKQIAEGDLRGIAIAARSADELGQLADGFNVMLVGLRDLTGQVLSVTENVNSAAAQISSSTRQQATSTKEQAATVQEITSTMQEISQTGAQIVAKAKEVAAVAEQASAASAAGMDAVENTNRTMEAIREQVEEVAENIVALSEKTQAVGEIIATVNEIAEQSNLLALNATIEAAEAGREGNRFSVVAAEMKNLADQAKECTVHVRKILGEIQKSINTSVMLTEEAVKRVESGKRQADVSENVIRQISSTTEESIQAFQQIIGATNQQQVGLEQVARGMQDIDQAAQQTATGTNQLEQAVVSLSALSNQLRTAVAPYKV
jgi:methyl-accepting chemotaxis protein